MESILSLIEQEIIETPLTHFKYLKLDIDKGIYVATLQDNSEHNIVRGYGKTVIEAINDMHSCLL